MAVETSKIAEIVVDALTDAVNSELEEHMKKQPYDIKCHMCGDDLEVNKSTFDGDYDLSVEVYPCQTCIEEAKAESEVQ
ncbi:hypothetical protein LCGC14_1506140 [marine sediment metagenome]|uniref:Uncharacterized protein n=1 Tax=marine sediment metagenome TaxID=412755 RepID=A0A0F9J2P5_9ZZZZ